jgi:hypothetical protein
MEARTPADEPDLIRSVGDDGKIGYLKKVDLDQGTPKSPEEAIQLQNVRTDGAGRVLDLDVADCVTFGGRRFADGSLNQISKKIVDNLQWAI